MLQQTTVATVRGRYAAFLERFPDVRSLARAREQSVLAAWSGLGYYARARHLHRAARELVRTHGGRLPREPETLQKLPGFGEYMAAAVAAIAFGSRKPAADANVTRVLSRLFAIPGTAGMRAHADAVRRRTAALLARGRPGDVTAALMDLGQLVCLPRNPACPSCPLARSCAARARGEVARYPRRPVRPAARGVAVAAAVARRDGRVLLVRSSANLLRGLWLFPSAEAATARAALGRLRRVARDCGLAIEEARPVAATRHTIVRRRLEIAVYRARPLARGARSLAEVSSDVRWLTSSQLAAAAIPTLTRKIAAAARVLDAPARRGRRAVTGP